MLRNPKVSKHLWSCYPDSNWSPCPAEQAPREPGATSDQNALRAGDEVSSFAYGKRKPSKPEGFEGFWSCYPDSNWSPCPAEQAPREPGATSDQNALRAGDEVSSFAYGKRKPSKPEGFEGFWSCYPDSNWRPCPAEQAPREPGTTSDQNALRARG